METKYGNNGLDKRTVEMCTKIYWSMQDKKLDVKKATREEIKNFIQEYWINGVNYNTARGYLMYINIMLEQEKKNMVFSVSEFDTSTAVKGIVKKEDMDRALKNVINEQDKFMIYALFNGILGKRAVELIDLKKEDINLKDGIISLPNRVVVMDEEFKEMARKALNQDTYYLVKGDKVSEFELSTDAPYVFSPKPMKKNNYGLDKLSYSGIRSRFYNTVESMGIEVTMDGLVKSGYVYRLMVDGVEKSLPEVEKWVEKNNISVCKYTLFKLYKDLY